MRRTFGILIFDGAEELDFVGPWEVFTMSIAAADYAGPDGPAARAARDRVLLIAEAERPVVCAKGMRVLPDHTLQTAPPLDVLLVPGGRGTRREVDNQPLLHWIAETAQSCEWVTSVCTGAALLTAAGPARGKTVTTHWSFIEALKDRGEAKAVRGDVRYIRDGNVVTAAGVSAGIDMALWLIGALYGAEHARATQHAMEYDPAPPYAGEV